MKNLGCHLGELFFNANVRENSKTFLQTPLLQGGGGKVLNTAKHLTSGQKDMLLFHQTHEWRNCSNFPHKSQKTKQGSSPIWLCRPGLPFL